MEELLALARDCAVTITFEKAASAYHIEARRVVDGKEYGCRFVDVRAIHAA